MSFVIGFSRCKASALLWNIFLRRVCHCFCSYDSFPAGPMAEVQLCLQYMMLMICICIFRTIPHDAATCLHLFKMLCPCRYMLFDGLELIHDVPWGLLTSLIDYPCRSPPRSITIGLRICVCSLDSCSWYVLRCLASASPFCCTSSMFLVMLVGFSSPSSLDSLIRSTYFQISVASGAWKVYPAAVCVESVQPA